jgi:hypothetical protein
MHRLLIITFFLFMREDDGKWDKFVPYVLMGFGDLVVSMLASGTQDRGFAPDRSHRIFRAKKSSACLPSEGK